MSPSPMHGMSFKVEQMLVAEASISAYDRSCGPNQAESNPARGHKRVLRSGDRMSM